ncbi:IS3 family transposase [PVC group bacterium]|nr:IS3 family transposase [PVC group bacterium]
MQRQRSEATRQRDLGLLAMIQPIKDDHPLWGYRRTWAYLKYRLGYPTGKNRIHRVMKENNLLVTKRQRIRARRGPFRSKPRAYRPNHYWGIDMTKIKMYPWGWLYLCIVLDWCTKEIVGYSLNIQSKTDDWLLALENAVNKRFPRGIRDSIKDQSLFLISDNGCQPTSQRFMMNCSLVGIKQIFTTWCNPKGNSDTERVMRTIKEDLVWTYDWDNPFAFSDALSKWINAYNSYYPHQSLNNMTPKQYYETFSQKPVPVLT